MSKLVIVTLLVAQISWASDLMDGFSEKMNMDTVSDPKSAKAMMEAMKCVGEATKSIAPQSRQMMELCKQGKSAEAQRLATQIVAKMERDGTANKLQKCAGDIERVVPDMSDQMKKKVIPNFNSNSICDNL